MVSRTSRNSAVFTAPVKRQVVVFDFEALRCEHREIGRARMDVKDFLAFVALKMMVMSVTGQLKSWIFPGQNNLTQRSVFDHGFEISIDRRNAQARSCGACELKHFLREQRPTSGVEGLSYRGALTG